MIKLEQVCYRYPRSSFSVEHVDFSVEKGECTALWGPNGSGKTTIGKLMAGILRPDSGRVLIDGQDSGQMSLGRIGSSVGFLFQEPSRQLFAVTVEEELTFAEILKGVSPEAARKKAIDLLALFGMEHMLEDTVLNLSRGEKQRLAVCALLCASPGILILDEPTSGLDEESIEDLSGAVRKVMEAGTGVVLISHDEDFVRRHASRTILVEGGRIYEKGQT